MRFSLGIILCLLYVVRCDFEDIWEQLKEEAKLPKGINLSDDFINKKDSSESKESGEESNEVGLNLEDIRKDTPTEEIDDDISRCSEECSSATPQKVTDNKQVSGENKCTKGCKLLKEQFKQVKETYKKTSPELLLGNAVDKCWEGCAGEIKSISKSHCISGCKIMRTKIVQKLKQKQLTGNDLDAKLKKAPKIENMKKEEIKVEPKEDKTNDILITREEDLPVQWTYVLWRPENRQSDSTSEKYAQMINMINQIMSSLNSYQEIDLNEVGKDQGWKDDRMQLRIPTNTGSRSAALTSGDDDFYAQVSGALDNIKQKVESTIDDPGFREELYYVLVGLCGFLLISTAFNSIFYKKETRVSDEDHYYLSGKTTTAKLPTYEDCIKADKELLVDMTGEGGELPLKYRPEPCPTLETDTIAVTEVATKNEDEDKKNIV